MESLEYPQINVQMFLRNYRVYRLKSTKTKKLKEPYSDFLDHPMPKNITEMVFVTKFLPLKFLRILNDFIAASRKSFGEF